MLRNHHAFKRNDKVYNKMKDEELYSKNSLKNLLLVPLPEVLKVIISKQQKKFLGVFLSEYSTAFEYTSEYQSKGMYLITCPPYIKGIR